MKAKKWNYKTHKYEPYELPESALLFTDDMEKECCCAQCGEKMKFGDGYTSMEIHNLCGFGFCVCGDCINEEIGRWHKAKKEEASNA